MKASAVLAISLLQAFLFAAHWFIFHTIVSFLTVDPALALFLRITLYLLSFSFIIAAVLSHRFDNPVVSVIYRIAAVWLGLLNFLFWASCLCWVTWYAVDMLAPSTAMSSRPTIAAVFFGLAFAALLYGLINARNIRERRIPIALPNLPPTWKGRTALLITDVHLGNINGARFSQRIAEIARRLNPDVIFIAGDLYDGTPIEPSRLAAPFFELAPPLGIYFSGGNHEEFGDVRAYEAALRSGGIRVLHNERVDVDGLQVIGVSYSSSAYPAHIHAILERLQLNGGPASVLLNHVPHRLPIVDQFGVSLQVSGHTHGGQIFPFTLATRWAFGKYTYGLQRFGKLQVLTSSGVGTWGPPMRVGTHPEVVLITFA